MRMPSIEEIIQDRVLIHAAEYDPAKRHEAYLRSRKLKGRKRGEQQTGSGGRAPAKAKAPVKKPAGHSAEVEALRRRLESLKRVLADLVDQAKKRSGVESKSSASKSSSSKSGGGTSKSDRKPLTEKQKKEAAQRSKDWREKHKDPSKTGGTEIEQLRAQIKDIQAKIQAALEKDRQRQQAKSKTPTATKGR